MRLTYELGYKGSGEYDTDNTKDMPINNIWKAINKLGKLEDILEKYAIVDLEQLDKRLEKSVTDFTYLGYGKREVKDYYNIEQKLGIDLITFFTALENGFYYKSGNTYCWTSAKWAWCIGRDYFKIQGQKYYFKDIGITWALKLEDFKND